MTARILVVDDVPANVKLMEARLSAEYFDVITALSGRDALAICGRGECCAGSSRPMRLPSICRSSW